MNGEVLTEAGPYLLTVQEGRVDVKLQRARARLQPESVALATPTLLDL